MLNINTKRYILSPNIAKDKIKRTIPIIFIASISLVIVQIELTIAPRDISVDTIKNMIAIGIVTRISSP